MLIEDIAAALEAKNAEIVEARRIIEAYAAGLGHSPKRAERFLRATAPRPSKARIEEARHTRYWDIAQDVMAGHVVEHPEHGCVKDFTREITDAFLRATKPKPARKRKAREKRTR